MSRLLWIALLLAPAAFAQNFVCPRMAGPDDCLQECYAPKPEEPKSRYADLESQHLLRGLASYYSSFFDGRKTANGEVFRNGKFSAAHLTLPLGCWVEVRSRATGKTLRLRVNDRGPYAKKFMLDLSQAAARFLGVDVHPDRYVDVKILALPGEELVESSELSVEGADQQATTALSEQPPKP